MWPDTRLTQLLGIDHPIIQAPMAGACTAELAAAVANAGGLGSIGTGGMTPEQIEARLSATRARTNRPINLNFFIVDDDGADPAAFAEAREAVRPIWARHGLGEPPAEPGPRSITGFSEEKLELVLAERPQVASFHFGAPPRDWIEAMQDEGVHVLGCAATVAEARALEALGMDAVIAQGWEAGGHRGVHARAEPDQGVGTFALIPQIVDAIDLPVIAAGGVADGRGVAAAFALGAAGVQIGTAFLLTPEAATDARRRALIRASDGTETMPTRTVSGHTARGLRSGWAQELAGAPTAPFPDQYALARPVMEAAPEAASFLLYGQSAPLATEAPAAQIMERLVAEAEAAFARLSLRL